MGYGELEGVTVDGRGVGMRDAEEVAQFRKKSWRLARSEGLALDQREMNAFTDSDDMCPDDVRKTGSEMKEKRPE